MNILRSGTPAQLQSVWRWVLGTATSLEPLEDKFCQLMGWQLAQLQTNQRLRLGDVESVGDFYGLVASSKEEKLPEPLKRSLNGYLSLLSEQQDELYCHEQIMAKVRTWVEEAEPKLKLVEFMAHHRTFEVYADDVGYWARLMGQEHQQQSTPAQLAELWLTLCDYQDPNLCPVMEKGLSQFVRYLAGVVKFAESPFNLNKLIELVDYKNLYDYLSQPLTVAQQPYQTELLQLLKVRADDGYFNRLMFNYATSTFRSALVQVQAFSRIPTKERPDLEAGVVSRKLTWILRVAGVA